MQTKKMWRPVCWLWLLAMALMDWTAADDSIFCDRPANMELCWWNNVNKRYLRFGRGDPFLRFGRSQIPASWNYNPFNHFGKRSGAAAQSDELEKYLENGGYLRFGRSVSSVPLLALLSSPEAGASIRKRRDVSEVASPVLKRTARNVQDGGFLRFGRNHADQQLTGNEDLAASLTEGLPTKKADPAKGCVSNADREYLRFGRARSDKRNYLRFGRSTAEGSLVR